MNRNRTATVLSIAAAIAVVPAAGVALAGPSSSTTPTHVTGCWGESPSPCAPPCTNPRLCWGVTPAPATVAPTATPTTPAPVATSSTLTKPAAIPAVAAKPAARPVILHRCS